MVDRYEHSCFGFVEVIFKKTQNLKKHFGFDIKIPLFKIKEVQSWNFSFCHAIQR